MSQGFWFSLRINMILRPSSESIKEKDDSVNEFDASTCSGDNFYNIF